MTDFERFWASYPIKVGKIATEKAWHRLKPDASVVATILQSIEDHRDCRAWREGYIPHPRTFLNHGCYLDELDPAAFAPSIGKQTSRLAQAVRNLQDETLEKERVK